MTVTIQDLLYAIISLGNTPNVVESQLDSPEYEALVSNPDQDPYNSELDQQTERVFQQDLSSEDVSVVRSCWGFFSKKKPKISICHILLVTNYFFYIELILNSSLKGIMMRVSQLEKLCGTFHLLSNELLEKTTTCFWKRRQIYSIQLK